MGNVHGLSSTPCCSIMKGGVLDNIPFSYFYAIPRLISFPSSLNNEAITYPNFTKKSIASADLIQKIAEHSGGLLNDGRTPLHSSRRQPFLPFFLVIQMDPCDVVTHMASKLFFESIPEFPALFIDLYNGLLILGIGSSCFHPNRHDRTSECPTK
jgi:hypothetical protein